MEKKIVIKISTPKGNFEIEKFIKEIQEEEKYRQDQQLIENYLKEKEEYKNSPLPAWLINN